MTINLLDSEISRHVIVTGAAGFIGSHTSELLINDLNCTVTGIDCFTDYYDRATKESNLAALRADDRFEFVEAPISLDLCRQVFDGADAVVHLAAQAGVRRSWADFDDYVALNINATKYVLEAAVDVMVPRVVYASSSSVYGVPVGFPTHEALVPAPRSPYGVTKLTAEQLNVAYAHELGLNTVSLRYFTVYGPRQRPDMATHRLINAARDGDAFPLYGDGSQVRDFTYVGDIARATALAALKPDLPAGLVANVCGGSPVTLLELIELVEELVGRPINLDRRPRSSGDVPKTAGSSQIATEALGWVPYVDLRSGVAAQVRHQCEGELAIMNAPVPTS